MFLKKMNLIDEKIIVIHTDRGLYNKYNYIVRTTIKYFISEVDTLVTTTHHNNSLWKKALNKLKKDFEITVIPNTAGLSFESENESGILMDYQKIFDFPFSRAFFTTGAFASPAANQ
jgi:predicted patatin/cPLA2 family phospholipase